MNPLFVRALSVDWDRVDARSYLRQIPALRDLARLEFSRPVTYFVGENGSGKSTLLEALAVAYGFNPEGGTRNYNFWTRDSHSELCGALTLTKGVRRARAGYFLRAETFYNVATAEEDEYSDIFHPSMKYHDRSHGEGFLELAKREFRPDGLYLLDEPEAALSPQRQLALLKIIDDCARGGAQFVIATHSPILLGVPDAEILSFDGGAPRPCAYEETDSFRVTEMFVNRRAQMLERLLGGDADAPR